MKIDLEFTSGSKTVSIHARQNSPRFKRKEVTNKVRSYKRTKHCTHREKKNQYKKNKNTLSPVQTLT